MVSWNPVCGNCSNHCILACTDGNRLGRKRLTSTADFAFSDRIADSLKGIRYLSLCVIASLINCAPLAPTGGLDSGSAALELEKLLRTAAEGSSDELYRLARNGGEGAWFALAAAADHLGFDELSNDLQMRSALKDAAPYGARSLEAILIENPGALANPLRVLNRVEKGEDKELRRARIAVLTAEGRYRLLAREMKDFSGASWEAPVLLAALNLGKLNEDGMEILKRFIAESSDPAALAPLRYEKGLDSQSRLLLNARLYALAGEASLGLDTFRIWLENGASGLRAMDYSAPPPVFAEIRRAAEIVGSEEEWANRLSLKASKLMGFESYAAVYQAGLLYWRLREFKASSDSFFKGALGVPRGLDADKALWFGLRALQRDSDAAKNEKFSALSTVFELWDKPKRFEDRLELFIHQCVQDGDWEFLESVYGKWGEIWPSAPKADGALVLASAVFENRLESEVQVDEYLEIAVNAAPFSWSGLRAAGLLNRDIPTPVEEEIEFEDGDDDLIIQLFLKWGLFDLSASEILKSPQRYSGETIRITARAIAHLRPRMSIRLGNLLWSNENFTPTRKDLLIKYPLPYGKLVSDIAVREGVLPEILTGLVRTESAWDTNAVSRSGAVGLGQFMPATWEEWISRLRLPENSDPTNPEINLVLSAAYLNWLDAREWTDGWTDVLVSYNAGGGKLRSWRRNRPDLGEDLFRVSIPIEEPRSYVSKVLSAATMYAYLYEGKTPRFLHDAWGLTSFGLTE